jgi:hypothetical protein
MASRSSKLSAMSLFCVLLLTAAAALPQEPQTPAPTAAPAVAQKPSDSSAGDQPAGALPVSIDRIRDKLSSPPAIKVEQQPFVFRVEVLGRKLSIEDILGPDYLKGPMPAVAGGMTHQEFLDLVTPKDVQGYAAFSNGQAATVAATSFAFQAGIWALQKAMHKFAEAKQEREREAARKEVQAALEDLEKARIKAGLPPK